MILTLKAQTNHFYHLDIDLRTEIKDLRESSSLQLQEFRIEQNKKWDETNKNIHKLYEAMNSL